MLGPKRSITTTIYTLGCQVPQRLLFGALQNLIRKIEFGPQIDK